MSESKSIGEILTDFFLNSQEPFAVAFRNHFANAKQQKSEGQTPVRIDCINTSLSDKPNEWLDNQDVMQLLHISPRTLQTLRSNGTLPFSRIKGKFYYKVSDLNALLESNYSGKLKKLDRDGD
jgi:hypothetical protein